ncbi:Endonuclease V [Nitrospira tepida]|uniref:Endonuclease V n=1 Tax=Nitrospira tepida TaxID=2973512 RepID=A0AA86N2F7_9BACT|nr:deoxyribonuclease V [Nitrospira tepida]CAI4033320.1 Endonuclease V [Nitrospira tepida]
MNVGQFHSWTVTPREAVRIQEQIRALVIPRGRTPRPKLVAGADAAFDLHARQVYAAVVVLAYPDLEVVETAVSRHRLSFPYVPGLLSFREAPALLRAFSKLRHEPDVVFIDGHGLSHPRAAGLACHIGLCLEKPTIGCAKSRLIGGYREPGPKRGATSPLLSRDKKVIGSVLRTCDNVRPVFVSVGHRIGLAQAVRLTLACGKGYRVPEPTRQADILAERAKREAAGSG